MTTAAETAVWRARGGWLLLLAFVAACSTVRPGAYYENDGPPSRPRDVADVPDAVPRFEPPSKFGNGPYTALHHTYYPLATSRGYRERGIASWYGTKFNGRRTASGEPYDMYAMTAAHKTLPIPCYVRVSNLRNGRSVIVRVNDRGPFLQNRLIDLSYAAAARLGIVKTGTGLVEVEAINPGVREVKRAPPEPDARIFVQMGAFKERERAQRLEHELRARGFRPVAVFAGGDLYRVRVGPIWHVSDSDALVKRAARDGYDTTLIIE